MGNRSDDQSFLVSKGSLRLLGGEKRGNETHVYFMPCANKRAAGENGEASLPKRGF